MKKEFKVKALTEKVETLEVNGQWSISCLNDCTPTKIYNSSVALGGHDVCFTLRPSAYVSLGN